MYVVFICTLVYVVIFSGLDWRNVWHDKTWATHQRNEKCEGQTA